MTACGGRGANLIMIAAALTAVAGCGPRNYIAPPGFYRDFELYSVRRDRRSDLIFVTLTSGWCLPQHVTTGPPESPAEHPVDVAA